MQVKKKEVQQKIYTAAVKEFIKNGYESTTMRNISKRSGVPIGNIYRSMV